jgi:hypothetical protein
VTEVRPDFDAALAAFLTEYQAPAIATARVAIAEAEAEPELEAGR